MAPTRAMVAIDPTNAKVSRKRRLAAFWSARAGRPVEVMQVIFEGDLFAQETVQPVRVTPSRDIYLYESWISFDMQSWKKTKSALSRKWDFTSPTYKNPQAGHIKIILNERNE